MKFLGRLSILMEEESFALQVKQIFWKINWLFETAEHLMNMYLMFFLQIIPRDRLTVCQIFSSIVHFIKPYRDHMHFVNWVSVRFFETGCI